MGRGPLNWTTGCCTHNKQIGLEGVEDEVDRHVTEAAHKRRKEGTKVVPIAISETVNVMPKWIAGIVARKAIVRASAGRSTPIR